MSHSAQRLARFEIVGLPVGDATLDRLPDSDGDWIPAVVPGGVHESLIAAGRIEHPFYGANERRDAWIDEREWWFRTEFADPGHQDGERVRLEFLGLDTVADVWLNGVHLGHHENQFRPAEFDVTDVLAEPNVLIVRFVPPLHGRPLPSHAAETQAAIAPVLEGLMPEDGSEVEGPFNSETSLVATGLRKAPFSWGWDFGPNLPSIGIWRPVLLHVDDGSVIRGHHVRLIALSEDRMRAAVGLRAECEGPADEVRWRLGAPGGRTFDVTAAVTDGLSEATLDIDDPELWWTHDLGSPALHDVTLELLRKGEVVDVVHDRVGLRRLVLDQSDDDVEGGRLFRFVLNGMPLFARGANWLPASTFVGSVTADQHAAWIDRAVEGNFTMIRVWGGGVYEHDSFYTACDERGVLVWQDFIFACTFYPSADSALQDEVAREAEYQVKRLRNRACLALWAGNNEVQMIRSFVGADLGEGNWGWHFFHRILPEAVAAFDGATPYWPGSPYGEGGAEAVNGTLDGDRHTWEVWHGDLIPSGKTFPTKGDERHYRRYLEDLTKFCSEFGIHASPELDTLRRWIPSADLTVHSPTFDQHNKDNPKNKSDEMLAVTTGLPSTPAEYVAFTQALQAEGMRVAVEHYRRRQPHCSGALVWQFNDVWPGFTWSLVDHDGVPKSAFYAVKRASAPVAVSFTEVDGGLELWLVNNSPEPVEVAIEVELATFDGQRSVEHVTARAEIASSQRVWEAGADVVSAAPDRYAWASSPDGRFPSARHYFAEIAQTERGPSSLEVKAEETGLRIRSIGHSYSVRIAQPRPGIRLSDNCFDLRDGDEVFIEVSGAARTGELNVAAYPGYPET